LRGAIWKSHCTAIRQIAKGDGRALLDFDFYKYWKLHENYAKMIEVVYATVSYGVFISGCG